MPNNPPYQPDLPYRPDPPTQPPTPRQKSFPYPIIPPEYEMEMLMNNRAVRPDTWAEYYQWLVDRGYMDRNPTPFDVQNRVDKFNYPPRNIPPGMDFGISGRDRVPKSVYELLHPQPTPPPGMGRPMPVPPGLMPPPRMPQPKQPIPPTLPPRPSPRPQPSHPTPPFSPPPDMGIKPLPPRENPRDQPPQDFPGPPYPPKSPLPQNPGIQPDPSGKITKAPVQKTTKPTLNSYIKRYERS